MKINKQTKKSFNFRLTWAVLDVPLPFTKSPIWKNHRSSMSTLLAAPPCTIIAGPSYVCIMTELCSHRAGGG